jgi:hypothetical protein
MILIYDSLPLTSACNYSSKIFEFPTILPIQKKEITVVAMKSVLKSSAIVGKFRLRNKNWVKRRWLDFRNGHGIYLIFLLTVTQFVIIQYAMQSRYATRTGTLPLAICSRTFWTRQSAANGSFTKWCRDQRIRNNSIIRAATLFSSSMFFDIEIKRKIKIANVDSTPTLADERIQKLQNLQRATVQYALCHI